jgi:plasmid stability protein
MRFDYLHTLLGPLGVWQHANLRTPAPEHGYSIDDQARALIVATLAREQMPAALHRALCDRCMRYIRSAFLPDGRVRNFRSAQGKWLEPVGSDDALGRTLWALYIWLKHHPSNHAVRNMVRRMERAMMEVHSPRALAFAALETENTDLLRRTVDKLLIGYHHYSDREWRWFEPVVTYENARLPQALFVAAYRLHHAEGIEVAHQALRWLIQQTFAAGHHRPVGNHGWLVKGGAPAQWDQQPVDAGAMVEACTTAYLLSHEPFYREKAVLAYEWYLGKNDHRLQVYEPETGFCHDALTPHGLNLNGGAESILSYLLAHLTLQKHGLLRP